VGHAGSSDRNNTSKVIAAWQYVTTPARLVLRSQHELPPLSDDSRIGVVRGSPANYWELWNDGLGDVYLHPHRWEGCGLPIYEALASGMPVMTTRWWPFVTELRIAGNPQSEISNPKFKTGWLPPSSQSLAIEVTARRPWTVFRRVTSHETTPRAIAQAVDRAYGSDLTSASRESRDWAEAHSWRTQAKVWRQLFEDLVAGRLPGEG
jgi:glycosyltransferase involved in cell wall biosynthesis